MNSNTTKNFRDGREGGREGGRKGGREGGRKIRGKWVSLPPPNGPCHAVCCPLTYTLLVLSPSGVQGWEGKK